MASDISVAWQCLSKENNCFFVTDQTPRTLIFFLKERSILAKLSTTIWVVFQKTFWSHCASLRPFYFEFSLCWRKTAEWSIHIAPPHYTYNANVHFTNLNIFKDWDHVFGTV
jgi:hypothetical protein